MLGLLFYDRHWPFLSFFSLFYEGKSATNARKRKIIEKEINKEKRKEKNRQERKKEKKERKKERQEERMKERKKDNLYRKKRKEKKII